MIILGIDPGIAIMGYGVIEYIGNRYRTITYNSILTPAHTPDAERLKSIYSQLRNIIYEYKPDVCAIEKLYYNNNAKTVISVAQGRGVAMLAAANEGLKVYEYTPLQIKQALTGYGRADKKQMQQMTKMILGLDKVPKPDDTADALAVAICHSHYANYNLLNEKLEEYK
ncbi:MAG: crossover junction endodeoxyribonuclease RuvC [Clostridia bacterium]|nr:crossover junction endodeoxyribonuclease RuvC [Clostridia bacterium]